ncbi:MAG: hypothetical protein KC431_16855 [Myxococcales bacterium]|nr:hypothetical protein [Myxococcales bacterium]
MSFAPPRSIADVVEVEFLRGARADASRTPDLLIEIPHGADERRHYDRLRGRLRGDLPADLHLFFHLNTDVGAWAYGRATAQALLVAAPERSVLLLRSLIPRTFVDCNRPGDYRGGPLDAGALTPGIPSYVRDQADLVLLHELHAAYVAVAELAYERICGAGGLALIPHTYGPRSLGIDAVDDRIVEKLRWACAPERHDGWPLRAEIDLLTRDGEGKLWAPDGAEEALIEGFSRVGMTAVANDTYHLHPSSLGWRWATQWPGRTLSLEIRRDLLVPAWTPFEEMRATDAACERVAGVLAPVLAQKLAPGTPTATA